MRSYSKAIPYFLVKSLFVCNWSGLEKKTDLYNLNSKISRSSYGIPLSMLAFCKVSKTKAVKKKKICIINPLLGFLKQSGQNEMIHEQE